MLKNKRLSNVVEMLNAGWRSVLPRGEKIRFLEITIGNQQFGFFDKRNSRRSAVLWQELL